MLPLTDYGWKNSERGLKIVWDSMSNMKRVQQRLISILRAVNATKETCYAFLKKGGVVVLVMVGSVALHAKCIKEKCFNKSTGPSADDTSLPHNIHTPEEIISGPIFLHTHTTEDINSDLECTYTPEEMSSKCENEENESNEDEDEVQCLEVDDPEIDNIMREVFGDENMLF